MGAGRGHARPGARALRAPAGDALLSGPAPAALRNEGYVLLRDVLARLEVETLTLALEDLSGVRRAHFAGPRREPYRIARVVFYLQDHEENGFALRVVPGSHRPDQEPDEAALRERRATPPRTS